jgi:integrase
LPFMDRGPSEWMFSPRESYRQVRRMIAEANRPNRKAKLYPSEVRTRYKKYARYDSAPPSKRPRRHHFITDTYRRSIGYAIKRAASAGVAIPHWHPHQLRHTMSTCISQMFGEQAAQRWLGHERLETTGIYTQRQVKELKDIARRLSSSFSDDSANMITGLVESVTASYDPKKPSAS